MLTTAVFCVSFIIVINGVTELKDPNFPGNPGWMKNFKESLPMNKPGFPGSPEWKRRFEEEMKGPDFPGSPEWKRKFDEEMRRPDFPGSPEWQRKFNESMNKTMNIPPPMVPCFPKCFPFPQDCETVADPGFEYPKVRVYGNQDVKIEHRSFMCKDPDYGTDTFYMLQTVVLKGEHSTTKTAKFYNKKGEMIDYSPKVRLVPANEDCSKSDENISSSSKLTL
ncbi:uncharacterized protein LOC120353802 isoform X2 [Nilaparvata lugens]|uniref:uncharacterized protein LOC120353802 isoform X2 n=1 Tax=Nilaparvata lugens TaxID=108931 RepID=UPI00193DD07E|nr:uncharacterized protein LOC120353802 isoform X2 [Nilaparvata lugens]